MVFLSKQQAVELTLPARLTRTADRVRAGVTATFFTGLLVASIVVGSRKLQNFDPALVIYTFATIFATWGVVYHYRVWLDKPPTRVYWERGWQLFREAGVFRGTVRLLRVATTHLSRANLSFSNVPDCAGGCTRCCSGDACSRLRSPSRWSLAGSRFNRCPRTKKRTSSCSTVFPCKRFDLHTLIAELLFHGLDVSAILVLGGIGLSLWRRFRDRGAQAVQSFALDFLPIILLFAISVTGLALTVSQNWLRGESYSFLAILHAITVIAALALSSVRKVLSYFSASRATGREVLSGGRRNRRACIVQTLRRTVCFENAYRGFEARPSAGRVQLPDGRFGRNLAGTVSRVQTEIAITGAAATQGDFSWLRRRFRPNHCSMILVHTRPMFLRVVGRMNHAIPRKNWLKRTAVSAGNNAESN